MANNNNEIKINVPEGMEIDKENSTFECIRFKPKIDILDGFKKGDFLYIRSKGGNEWYFIFSGVEKKHSNVYSCGITNVMTICYMDSHHYLTVCASLGTLIEKSYIDNIRYATVGEVHRMLERLDAEGWEWDAEKLEIRKKSGLPKTWQEFCETHPIGTDECFIGSNSFIVRAGRHDKRTGVYGRNILPNRETAEAFCALMQLVQLRDCYNNGWKPDWNSGDVNKYCIETMNDDIISCVRSITGRILTFKTEELRDKFLKNFRDLIEVAKPLI